VNRRRLRIFIAAALAGTSATAATFVALPTARSNPYESFVTIENEDDLYDLQAQDAITDDTFNQLLDLLDRGVDLNTSDRDELYELPNLTYDDVDAIIEFRKLQSGITDPASLVSANVISQEKLFAIAAFLTLRPNSGTPLGAHGYVRLLTRMSIKDRDLPATYLRGRSSALTHWSAGVAAVMTRLRIGEPVWDPTRKALLADGPGLRVEVPKIFVRYRADDYDAVAGSYRIGFGQRLVFDNTIAYNPNGLMMDDQILFSTDLTRSCRESKGETQDAPCDTTTAPYVTPDFRWRDGLFGAAGGAKHIAVGDGWMQLYGWASYSRRSIYQYELVNRGVCEDPNNDADPNCSSPTVYRRPGGATLNATTKFNFETLPNVFGEALAGANATYFVNRRAHVGVTAYGAHEQVLVGGVQLDTQEYSRIPTGRSFGAVGSNVAFGHKWLDVYGEVAYSYDKSPDAPGPIHGGGGPGAIVRATATQKKQELEASLRYYSIDFVNPYARPIAETDEVNGQTARDELGLRLRHSLLNSRLAIRSLVDFWIAPSDKTPKLDAYVRADVKVNHDWKVGGWLRVRDKDLRESGHTQCFEIPTEVDLTGAPVPCKGKKISTIGRLGYDPNKRLGLTLQLQHDLVDDPGKHPTSFRHDIAAFAIALIKPTNRVRIRERARYRFQDIFDNTYLEQSVGLSSDVDVDIRDRDSLRVRLDIKYFLDKRSSTLDRTPNPEFTLWLGYEAKY
jgi:hypothetical protein